MEQLVNKSFQIKLDADHPILKDHKVDSLSVLPGVVYLDYIYRVFEANNIDIKKYGIKNITFKNPLKLLSGEKERSLNMYIVKENDSILIIIKSIGADNKEPLLHFEGEVEPYEKDSVKDFPIEREIAAANVTVDMRDIYKKATEFKIQHGPFMTASGKLYKTDKNCIAHLRLPENFAGENRFIAHPCLLDASTLIGLVTFDIQYLTKPLLPIYIERFRIKSRIPEEIYVIARRLNGTKYENQDIVTNDIAIYNKYGHHIASFEKLKGKTIRDSAAFSIDKEKLKRSANGNGVPINISEKLNLEQSIENDLIHLIHQHYNIPLQELALDVGFYELGLDSNALMVLGESIEERIGKKIYPTLLFEYPTIQLLANYLKEKYGSSYKFSKTNQQERLEVENDVFIHKRVEERRIEQSKESVENCFAIVGLQGRFPQAEGIEKFFL